MSAPYLLSKCASASLSSIARADNVLPFYIRTIDPIFAVSIGIAAAAVRINREEKEQGRSTTQSYESLKRRIAMVWAGQMGDSKAERPEGR